MDYKTLKDYVRKFHLEKYISLFRKYTLYDKEYSIFYLKKNKMLWRLINGLSKKYVVFQNCDLEYGKIKNEMVFINIDDASNYLWEMFVEYVYVNDDKRLIEIMKKL